jgi:UDP-glucuronate decarboxylase
MTTVLVLGGAGFLGSHLCESLLDANFSVICVDNLSTGRTENLKKMTSQPNFTFIEHDVKERFSIKCEVIVNMASPASPPRYQLNPVGTLLTNFLGTFNALELARANNARFIQASTSEIYGEPLTHPQKEDYWGNVNPIGPRSCYDEGKRAAETLCSDFRKQYKVNTTIVRIFNTYGSRMSKDDGRVVSNFISQALRGDALTLYGEGTQTRSFCYVSDLISGFMQIILKEKSELGPVNLGNPTEISMIDLANLIITLTNSKSELKFLPLPEDDPSRRKPDIQLAKSWLKWEPKVGIEEGLVRTISEMRIAQ